MQIPARTQAVIELLSLLEETGLPADRAFKKYTSARRYIGSKDRQAISQLFYTILRHKGALVWQCESCALSPSPRHLVLAALCLLPDYQGQLTVAWHDASHGPAALTGEEEKAVVLWNNSSLFPSAMPAHARYNLPFWLYEALCSAYGHEVEVLLEALAAEAPVDLRCNLLKSSPQRLIASFAKAGIEAMPIPHSPWGVRLSSRISLASTEAYEQGWCEPQDSASQWAAEAVGALPGQAVLDYCAGAGGKTLALAAMMQNKGSITACDVSAPRLKELEQRCERAGVTIVKTRLLDGSSLPTAHYDHVVVDAPCSGTGTWRRNPDARWRYKPEDIDAFTATQRQIIDTVAPLVKAGGRLSYITCSLLPQENEQQALWISHTYPQFSSVSAQFSALSRDLLPSFNGHLGLQFLPHTLKSDGIYIVVFDHKTPRPDHYRENSE